MHQLRVLVIDDHPLLRRSVATLLGAAPDLTVVATVGTGQEALAEAELTQPDVAIVDLNLPGISGLEVTRALRRRHSRLAVVILTVHADEATWLAAFRAGAAAYLTKDAGAADLIEAVRRAGLGEAPLLARMLACPARADRLLATLQNTGSADNDGAPLTPREIEVLDCVARGMSNKEVAVVLSVTEHTVKNHLTSILDKLQVTDRTQAVLLAARRGWVTLGSLVPPVPLGQVA